MSIAAGELIPRRAVDPRASLPALEREILARWRERDVFAQSLRMRAGAPAWTFYEGPPTTNGPPGVHHVLSRVFKDIYPRYRTMRGNFVARKGGWDCHGLPVEIAVEKELGIKHKSEIEQYGIDRFNARCREAVFSYLKEWNELTERIGFWVDLDDAYRTLDDDYIESVWWAIAEIARKGLLYEGHRVVPYCPRCGTALSSHEVSLGYEDVEDPSVYVRLPVRGGAGDGDGDGPPAAGRGPLRPGDELVVWTTTPWTLVSNAAVAVDPELEYVRARPAAGEAGGPVFVVAAPLVESVLGPDAEVLDRFRGRELEGVRYVPPFDFIPDEAYGERARTVLLGDFVTADDGTGLVHTAIAFGEDDFRLGQANELNVVNPVRLDGTFDERIGRYEGRFVKDADDDLIDDLRARGRLLRATRVEHSYPHCWRCATPLLYYAKPSWYIATSRLRDNLLASNETVNWYPDHIKHGRFGDWLSNNVDWALSRERYWGTPLPVWRCEVGGHVHVVGSFAELRERSGQTLSDPHRPFVDEITFPCEQCEGRMRRVPEVIDVWFDSGSMPFAQHHAPFENAGIFEQRFPADFICEALDQTRGWFYSLLAISTLLSDRAPYRNVVCLGLILDENGEKMSKSRGNIVEPMGVLDEFGADALRWYFFTSKAPWDGYRFSTETIREGVRQFLLPLWNTYYFYAQYAMLNERTLAVGDAPAPAASDLDLDAWLASRVTATATEVAALMDAYDATAAGRAIAALVDELSNWYVRRSRRRFWDGDRAAFTTLRDALLTIGRLLAPFCPFIADEIYDNLDGTLDSVHLCDFPAQEDLPARDVGLEEAMATAQQAVRLGRTARGGIKVRQPLAEAVVVATGRERAAIERLADVIRDELNVKRVRIVDAADELASYQVKPHWRRLGPRFGKEMPQAAAAIAALDGTRVAASLREGREVVVTVAGRDHVLGPDDMELVMAPLEGYSVEREGGHAVALELALDEGLIAEGHAREVVHAVQNARRNAGLQISDRITLELTGDPALLAAARVHESYVARETLATSLTLATPSSGAGADADGAGGDGAGGDSARDGADRDGDWSRESVTLEGRALMIALRPAAP